MADITCARCAKTAPQQAAPPMAGTMGIRIYETVCGDCWLEWQQQQTAIINHYGLNLRDAEARRFLTQQTEAFLFASPTAADE